jgi:hypothetical protein
LFDRLNPSHKAGAAVPDLLALKLAFKLVSPSVQASGALPVDGFDRPHLRGVPAAVSDRQWAVRVIAFIMYSADIPQMLDCIGAEYELPHLSRARGSPLWDECDADVGVDAQVKADLTNLSGQ